MNDEPVARRPRSSFIVHRSSLVSFLLHHFHEMRDLGDHPAHFSAVDPLCHAMHLAEAESLEGLAHLDRASDAAADLLDADLLGLALLRLRGAHASPSAASSLPRSALYWSALRSCLRASNVALTTLCGFAVP